MYEWFYGTDRFPEKHERKNALVEMSLSIAGCASMFICFFTVCVLWLKGVV